MTLPDWSRPGEGRARSIALVLAIALPVIIHAAVGWQAWDGTTFLLLALPVLLVSWLGGLVAGLLATAVALAIPLARMMGGAPVDLVAVAALAALGVFAAVAFECWLRIHRSSSAERDEVTRRDAFHAAALETAADLAWSGRLDGERLVIETATPGFSHSLGVPFEEINRRGGFTALLDADDAAQLEAACHKLASGQSASGELRWQSEGRIRRFRYDMRATGHAAGGEVAVCGTMREITEHHELVQQLREWKDRYEAAVMASSLVLYDYDSADNVVVFGGDVERMLGHWAGDLNGALGQWLQRLHPEDVDRFVDAHRTALDNESPLHIEYRVRRSDGEFLTIEHTGRVIADGVLHLVGLLRDVSARRRMPVGVSEGDGEQRQALARSAAQIGELEQKVAELEVLLQRRLDEIKGSNLRKDEFLATLAHELRNPLAPIRNASMLLGLQDGSPQGLDWIRRVIERQTDHMARLIDDLLDVSRITRAKLTLRLERVALDRVIEAAIESVRPQIDAQRHQLSVEVQPGLWLQGDQVRLTQIFTNLLANAVKYTSPGGAIRVEAAADDVAVQVTVRDNGIGIPSDQLPHLFQMFYQVDRSIERAHAGLGIGLTLVERLVALHGGDVRAFSEGIGRGAEFRVRLPLADRPVKAEAPVKSVARSVRGLRILVADDSVDSALTLTALLAAAGHEVEAVHDGFAALHRAAELRPHVLVLDIGMPGLNGYDTCRRIRAEPWGRHAVIIAVTGWGTDEDRRRSREAGFDAHLVKPVDYSELQKHFALDNISL
jgi:PAS domain S-box-containing protein